MAAMLIDHIGAVFFPDALWMRIIGRISFPLFAWGIAMGYSRTRNLLRYGARLLVTGLVTQLPYSQLFGSGYLNICFTLLAGLVVIWLYNYKVRWAGILGIAGVLALVHVMNFEYGIYGVLTILAFYVFQDDSNLPAYQLLLTLGGIRLYRLHMIQLFSVVSSMLLPALKKVDFKLNKLVQYGFYPLHIILLLIIKNVAV